MAEQATDGWGALQHLAAQVEAVRGVDGHEDGQRHHDNGDAAHEDGVGLVRAAPVLGGVGRDTCTSARIGLSAQ